MTKKIDKWIYNYIANYILGINAFTDSDLPPLGVCLWHGLERFEPRRFSHERRADEIKARRALGISQGGNPEVVLLYERRRKLARLFDYDSGNKHHKVILNALERVLEAQGGVKVVREFKKPEVNIQW